MQVPASRPAKILIVDDDRCTSAAIKRALARAGFEPATAGDGATALELFAQGRRYDAVVLDRCMPRMDGLQVLKHLKATPELCEIPVVMATAMGSQEDILEGVRHGAYYYLLKPLNLALLLQIVGAAVDDARTRSRLWAELRSTRSALGLLRRGTFRYQTVDQCEELATLLARACPDPQRATLGLFELMLNALEHGNFGITYQEKTALVETQGWAAEMRRRQQLPENRGKAVTISMARTRNKITFRLRDMGRGFPWQEFQELNSSRIFDNHGRGILMARYETFDRVQYQGLGNVVVMEIACP